MSDAYVPMPLTCHPFYEDSAEGIRRLIEASNASVRVPEPRAPLVANYTAMGEPVSPFVEAFRVRTLDVKKCAGPAPFVGDPELNPAMYFWRVAVDELGRHVAGEARLEWRLGDLF